MASPNDAPVFGNDIYVTKSSDGAVSLSEKLADLLVMARKMYAWPIGETAAVSQQRIIDLETQAHQRIENLDLGQAHWIVRQVSSWGGNNAQAQWDIDAASGHQKSEFETSIRKLSTGGCIKCALESLSNQPGLRLVMATKIYRFCAPQAGAAVDRHSSYFFNSLRVNEAHGGLGTSTQFKREWATGKHRTSRLAIYTPHGYKANLDEYLASYLPLLAAIAGSLNRRGIRYLCAASSTEKRWRPADVEMAAYHWWSRNGPP